MGQGNCGCYIQASIRTNYVSAPPPASECQNVFFFLKRTIFHPQSFGHSSSPMSSHSLPGIDKLSGDSYHKQSSQKCTLASLRTFSMLQTQPIKKLYYSVGKYELICIYCASEDNLNVNDDFYPQCLQCSEKEKVKKRKQFHYIFF